MKYVSLSLYIQNKDGQDFDKSLEGAISDETHKKLMSIWEEIYTTRVRLEDEGNRL